MCEVCGKQEKIIVSCKPILVKFSVQINPRTKKLKRTSDISAEQLFELDTNFDKLDIISATCACGNPVDLSKLDLSPICVFCSKIVEENSICVYNNMLVCKTCLSKLNYCRTCPFIKDCILRKS